MHFDLCTITPLEAAEIDKTVLENQKQFKAGFEKGLLIVGYVFLGSYVLKGVLKVRPVHAIETFQKTVENAELQPTASIEKAVVVGEIVRKNRHFNLNVVLGVLAALFLSWIAHDTIRNTINMRAEDVKLTQLGEGVIEISKVISQKHKVLLEFVEFEETARKYRDLL